MRGKNIVWMSLIAMMLVASLAGLVAAPATSTKILVDPDLVTGHPEYNDTFDITIRIQNAKDVYGWGLDLKIAALDRVISPIAYQDGGFIPGGFLVHVYDKTLGLIHLGSTFLGPSPGVSGDGNLIMVTFRVQSAGECALELVDTKLVNNVGDLMPHQTRDGYYIGPTVNLVNKVLDPGHSPSVSEDGTLTLMSSLKNLADDPMYARARFDIVTEEGKYIKLFGGQSYRSEAPPPEYYYVDEYIPWINEWTLVGDAPYLGAIGDDNYIYHDGSVGEDYLVWFPISGQWGFDNITLAGRTIAQVEIEAYIKYEYYDADNDIDTYARNPPENVAPTSWVGSLWGDGDWEWRTVRWTGDKMYPDIFPGLGTEEGFNAFQIRYFMYWTADDIDHGQVWIDAVRMKVTFSPVSPLDGPWVVVPPGGGTFDMPVLTWELLPQDVGSYRGTCFIEYRYYPPPPPDYAMTIQRSRKVSSFKFQIKP